MINALIVALNPSIDCEWRVEQIRWEEKNTIESERRWAGGKGVNVARWLRHLGGSPRLLIPLGGPTGKELAGCLRREHLDAKILSLRQATRVNVIVTTAGRRQLRFNPKGPQLNSVEWKAVLNGLRKGLSPFLSDRIGVKDEVPGGVRQVLMEPDSASGEFLSRLADTLKGGHQTGPVRCPPFRVSVSLVLSGGLPPGLPANAYAQLLHLAHRAKARSFLDCDGAALAAAVRAKPFLVKPNVHELAQWRGKSLSSLAEIKTAARALSNITRGWVLVSRGRAGALLIHSPQRCDMAASAPRVEAVNTVGAGDAMLAGVIHKVERGSPPEEWLRWGVATGTAATQCRAGELAKISLIRQFAQGVTVRRCSENGSTRVLSRKDG